MQRQRKLPLEAVAPRAFEATHVTALLRLVHEHIYMYMVYVAPRAFEAKHVTALLRLVHAHIYMYMMYIYIRIWYRPVSADAAVAAVAAHDARTVSLARSRARARARDNTDTKYPYCTCVRGRTDSR
jgi:hypothetical protein